MNALQAGSDWRPSLLQLFQAERRTLYALSLVEEGMDVDKLQPLYLRKMLTRQLEPVRPGSQRMRLRSLLYRAIAQVRHLLQS